MFDYRDGLEELRNLSATVMKIRATLWLVAWQISGSLEGQK